MGQSSKNIYFRYVCQHDSWTCLLEILDHVSVRKVSNPLARTAKGKKQDWTQKNKAMQRRDWRTSWRTSAATKRLRSWRNKGKRTGRDEQQHLSQSPGMSCDQVDQITAEVFRGKTYLRSCFFHVFVNTTVWQTETTRGMVKRRGKRKNWWWKEVGGSREDMETEGTRRDRRHWEGTKGTVRTWSGTGRRSDGRAVGDWTARVRHVSGTEDARYAARIHLCGTRGLWQLNLLLMFDALRLCCLQRYWTHHRQYLSENTRCLLADSAGNKIWSYVAAKWKMKLLRSCAQPLWVLETSSRYCKTLRECRHPDMLQSVKENQEASFREASRQGQWKSR